MDNALEIHDLSKRYDDFYLDHLNLSLPKGSIMGFIGENGAGKSTTIKLILNLIHRDTGKISVFGKDNIEDEREIKEEIGAVLDECNFPDQFKAPDISLMMRNIYKNWDDAVFRGYLKKFSLPEEKIIKDFSRGMKMKLSIAAALSHQARLLLLDEATSGLDPIVRDEILDILLEFIQDETHSIFISSHIISDLEKIADYICFIHKGKLLFSQSKDQLLYDYGVLKCTNEEFAKLDKSIIEGFRKNQFGAEALIKRKKAPGFGVVDPVGIEDIMLFYTRGDRK